MKSLTTFLQALSRRAASIAPGLAVFVLIGVVAMVANRFIPLLSAMLFAIILGMAARNLNLLTPRLEPGVVFSGKTVLRTGVVLLGFRLALPDVLHLGFGPLIAIAGTVLSVYTLTLLVGRKMRTAHSIRVLTATGTAICGAAAVAGMSSVVRPDPRWADHDEEVGVSSATAVASVTVFGTLTMIALPLLAASMGLTPMQTGVWIGTAVHEVGQVVASAGFVSDPTVLDVATLTKLGRVVLLAPLVAVVGYLETRREKAIVAMGRERALAEGRVQGDYFPDLDLERGKMVTVPLFVLGFLAAMAVRSVAVWMNWYPTLESVFAGLDWCATVFLTVAMGAMGAGVHFKTLIRRGGKGLVLGAVATVVATVVSLLLTLAFVS
ncbi:MAG: putative sulfate exporter family transporter [Actinomycetaceae bacterium]|nr:putative sulfate exporter family transporter [Actinomycetaceae bacterium]